MGRAYPFSVGDSYHSENCISTVMRRCRVPPSFYVWCSPNGNITMIWDVRSRWELSSARLLGTWGPTGPCIPTQHGILNRAINLCNISQSISREEEFFSLWQSAALLCGHITDSL